MTLGAVKLSATLICIPSISHWSDWFTSKLIMYLYLFNSFNTEVSLEPCNNNSSFVVKITFISP
ncbi:hypothetical protein NW739_03625 [Mycoplasmopsis felis]|uniref:hypothetical protein n=1 Tax=Mycoplasmopsis felis TaxID=33923 RepID=UPI0021DFEB01|nr:hypothetical protein [Mycoplasmopsis felis]MCU9939818.1 hypothetical protein [Mycoplasmopsis felis]